MLSYVAIWSDCRFKTRQWYRKQTICAECMVVELQKIIATANIFGRDRQDSKKENDREQIGLKGAETKRRRREGREEPS